MNSYVRGLPPPAGDEIIRAAPMLLVQMPRRFRPTTRCTCESTPRIKTESTLFRSPRMGRPFLNHANADEVLDNSMRSVSRLTVDSMARPRASNSPEVVHTPSQPNVERLYYMLSNRGIRICLGSPDAPPVPSLTIQTLSTASRVYRRRLLRQTRFRRLDVGYGPKIVAQYVQPVRPILRIYAVLEECRPDGSKERWRPHVVGTAIGAT